MSGEDFDFTDNKKFLAINSPKDSVGGPYKVVYKDAQELWAIVALDWNGNPVLGIRWFWGTTGMPSSRGYPTWFILPRELINSILSSLPIDFEFLKMVEKFLAKEISGDELTKDIK